MSIVVFNLMEADFRVTTVERGAYTLAFKDLQHRPRPPVHQPGLCSCCKGRADGYQYTGGAVAGRYLHGWLLGLLNKIAFKFRAFGQNPE